MLINSLLEAVMLLYSDHHDVLTHVTKTRQKAFKTVQKIAGLSVCVCMQIHNAFSYVSLCNNLSSLWFSDVYLWQMFLVCVTAALPERWHY